ncbi:MAG: hypothetical protein AAF557_12115 [Pseudomonadota bacterium]
MIRQPGRKERVVAVLAALWIGLQSLAIATAASASGAESTKDRLIFYVEDALAASEFYSEMTALDSQIYRAANWLADAAEAGQGEGEAMMHARAVIDRAKKEMPKLRSRLSEFPINGPSFPPVFYWFSDWPKLQSAWLDQMVLRLEHLEAESAAVDAQDWDRIWQIRAQREEDLSAFQQFFIESDRKSLSKMPDDHPDRMLSGFFNSLDPVQVLAAERLRAVDEIEVNRLTLEIIRMSQQSEQEMTRMIAEIDGVLQQHYWNLLPYAVVLTDDSNRGDQVAKAVVEQYRDTLDVLRRWVVHSRDLTDLEAKSLQVGWTVELLQDYNAQALKMDDLRTEYAEGWRIRAALLADAIAR